METNIQSWRQTDWISHYGFQRNVVVCSTVYLTPNFYGPNACYYVLSYKKCNVLSCCSDWALPGVNFRPTSELKSYS